MPMDFTPMQQAAINHRGSALLISAGAGSGKTRVLIERLMSLIEQGTDVDRFLVITYTRAAAAELRSRLSLAISQRLADNPADRRMRRQSALIYRARINTIHSFCSDIIRESAHAVGVRPDFRQMEESEAAALLRETLDELLESKYPEGDPAFLALADMMGAGRDDSRLAEIVLETYSAVQSHPSPEKWISSQLAATIDPTADVADTPWGALLIERAKSRLRYWRGRMADAIVEVENDEDTCKAYLPSWQTTAQSLAAFAEALENGWDAAHLFGQVDFPRTGAVRGRSGDPFVEGLKQIRSDCKKAMEKISDSFSVPSADLMADMAAIKPVTDALYSLVLELGSAYAEAKKRRGALDFSDLEHLSLAVLTDPETGLPTPRAGEISARFAEILVDEYQDVNRVQEMIFAAVSDGGRNVTMVGDVKQSIYRFRLADPGIFLKKYRDYLPVEKAQPGEGRKILLSRNFRSCEAVLEAANDVFRRCMSDRVGGLRYGDAEALVEGLPHKPLEEPEVELHVISTGEDAYAQEAAFVADRIAQLLDGTHTIRDGEGFRPIQPEDIAILLRSPNSVGQDYQEALARRGIRSAFGSGRDLLQTGEVSLMRSLLQIISNPRQDIPLLAVLASPVFGFTADDLARVRAGRRYGDFYSALWADETEQSRTFLHTLETLRQLARTENLCGLMEHIFCLTRADSIYAAMEGGPERTANLREFYQLVMDFESTARRDLSQFLEHLELMEEKGLSISEASAGGAVEILSIHKSKGLEYPVVFLSALSRGFNREDLRAQVLCDGVLGLGLSAVDQSTRVRYPTIAKRAIVARAARENLSEELRVLYVAMTRAKDRLIMTYATKKPEEELARIARCLEPGGAELMAGSVSCPGQWVLMEAMCRTESGRLFDLAQAQPGCTRVRKHHWRVDTVDCPAPEEGEDKLEPVIRPRLPEGMEDRLARYLAVSYGHEEATQTPSKQTVTQLKGRDKDNEAAEQTHPRPTQRTWRRIERASSGGKEFGNVMHGLMQYLRFDRCATEEGLEEELLRLTGRGLLTQEQADQADRQGILSLFETEVGRRLIQGQVLREFKFSILDDGEKYGKNLAGEQVLLQGVVDCALLEPDGITILDFKTDRVKPDGVEQIKERYRSQVQIYAQALERIYQMKVKKQYLYLFSLRELVEL